MATTGDEDIAHAVHCGGIQEAQVAFDSNVDVEVVVDDGVAVAEAAGDDQAGRTRASSAAFDSNRRTSGDNGDAC